MAENPKVRFIKTSDEIYNANIESIDDYAFYKTEDKVFLGKKELSNEVTGVKGSNETLFRVGEVTITKDNIGLGKADNTPDAEKAVLSATKLATIRTILTDLASNTAADFDGTKNVTPGVKGVLGLANGGTGNTTGTAQYVASHDILEGTDLNNLTDSGFYVTAEAGLAAKLVNCPISNGSVALCTIKRGPVNSAQILVSQASATDVRLFIRTCYQDEWGEWIQVYTPNNPQKDIAGNAATATKLTSSAGSETQPVYFKDGKPVATAHALEPVTTTKEGLMSAADKVKLDGIDTNANKYTLPVASATVLGGVKSGTDISVDASGNVSVVDDSHNHVIGNVDGLQAALDAKVPKTTTVNGKALSGNITLSYSDVQAIPASDKGAKGGVATLGTDGKVPSSQLPSYVDDVIEGYLNGGKFYKEDTHTTEIPGEAGKIYIDLHTSKTYRWSGTVFSVISETLALGTTSSTAFYGDKGQTAYEHATAKGTQLASGLWKVTTNAQGHVTAGTAVSKADITGLGIPGSDTTYGNAVANGAAGLMTGADKAKLDGIAAGANAYSLPTASATVLGGVKTGFKTADKDYAVTIDASGNLHVNVPWTDNNTWVANSATAAGYVVSGSGQANKVWKTDANGAPAWRDDADTKYTLPVATSGALGGVKSGGDITVATTGAVTVTHATSANTATSATNADTVDGYHAGFLPDYGCIPTIEINGVTEIGKYLDFHSVKGESVDHDARITATKSGLTLSGITSGTFSGNLTGKASTAGVADSANSVTWDHVTGKPAFNYLPLTGGTLTGNLTGTGFTGKLNPLTGTGDPIYIIRNVTFDEEGMDPTHTDRIYFEKLLAWICKNHNVGRGIFIGSATPNSSGTVIVRIYDTNKVKDGLPEYSSGLFIGLDPTQTFLFGTVEYVYHIHTVANTATTKVSSAASADTATTANKTKAALSWSGAASGSFDGSTAASFTIPTWSTLSGKPTFATVATSGNYNDLTNKPTIPAAYSLPTASASTKGGVLLGYAASGKNYALQVDSSGKAYVYVPWSDTNTTYSAGTGLSLSSGTFTVTGVKDSSNANAITISYAESSVASATYGCVWDGYHITSMTLGNIVKSGVGTSAIGSSSKPVYWNGSHFVATTNSIPSYSAFQAGTDGLVPAPKMYSSSDYYLSGDGGWQELPSAPTLRSLIGSSAIGGRYNPVYWNGSNFVASYIEGQSLSNQGRPVYIGKNGMGAVTCIKFTGFPSYVQIEGSTDHDIQGDIHGCFVGGESHNITYDASDSLVVGYNNNLGQASNDIVAGYDNHTYAYNSSDANFSNGIIIGNGNYINQNCQGGFIGGTFANNPSASSKILIGNGTSSTKKNVFRVSATGAVYGTGSYNSSGADYAEFVKEWADGNPDDEDRVGYFVTVKNQKLYIAKPGDYIMGIVSGNPSIVGNGDEDYMWKYKRDEFNRPILEEVPEEVPDIDENGHIKKDENGNSIYKTGEKMEMREIVSEDYDPTLPYVERKDRPEWDYVGMKGVLPVRDDGTCIPDAFCKCGEGGIATFASERGFDTFYVIERINDHVVSVQI